jgi:hypothetical protein
MYYPAVFLKENLERFFIDEKTGYFKFPNKVKSENGNVYTLDPLSGENAFYLNEKGEEIEAYVEIYDSLSGRKILELRSKTKCGDDGRTLMRNVRLIPFE